MVKSLNPVRYFRRTAVATKVAKGKHPEDTLTYVMLFATLRVEE